MPSDELLRSWQRTEGYLRQAIEHLPDTVKTKYAIPLADFMEFLEHNELGLAFETLVYVLDESSHSPIRTLELLALAAASMGLANEQNDLDRQLAELRGFAHRTVLPP